MTAFWGHDPVCDPELLFIVGAEEDAAFPKLDAVRTASRYQPACGQPDSTDDALEDAAFESMMPRSPSPLKKNMPMAQHTNDYEQAFKGLRITVDYGRYDRNEICLVIRCVDGKRV